jgi:hypothetical protein
MERNLNNEDFEEFLKLKTDHYKLYPSDKVWKGIYQSLHIRRRWFTVGGSLLFLSALLFINYEFNDKKPAAIQQPSGKITSAAPAAEVKHPTKTLQNSIPEIIIASSVTKAALPSGRKTESTLQPVTASTEPVITSKEPAAVPAHAFNGQPVSEPGNNAEPASTSLIQSEINGSETPDLHTQQDNVFTNAEERTPHDGREINWLQEMAALKLSSARRNRFNLQLYFSPTISYRKLTDGEKSKDLSNVPLATNELGVNDFVDHKPSIGLEIGSNLLFSPSKKLTLKTGLQVNYSRYSIKAYMFYFEKANIGLLTAGRIADTMSSYTSLRNFNGYSPELLQNQYLQLSLPLGAEYKLLGNKRLQLNVAGTIQPTYLLYNDTYLLSTDFINYTKEPSLVRKWNVHTSAEAFVSYYIGGMRWQIGPQFRYQTLSSYNDRYPIKEYLMEYGVKFGVSKTLR